MIAATDVLVVGVDRGVTVKVDTVAEKWAMARKEMRQVALRRLSVAGSVVVVGLLLSLRRADTSGMIRHHGHPETLVLSVGVRARGLF